MKKSEDMSAWRRNGWKEKMIEESAIMSAVEKLNWKKIFIIFYFRRLKENLIK